MTAAQVTIPLAGALLMLIVILWGQRRDIRTGASPAALRRRPGLNHQPRHATPGLLPRQWNRQPGWRWAAGLSAAAATIRRMSVEHQAALSSAESFAVSLPPVAAGHPGERAAAGRSVNSSAPPAATGLSRSRPAPTPSPLPTRSPAISATPLTASTVAQVRTNVSQVGFDAVAALAAALRWQLDVSTSIAGRTPTGLSTNALPGVGLLAGFVPLIPSVRDICTRFVETDTN
jgi:hypothetical protein